MLWGDKYYSGEAKLLENIALGKQMLECCSNVANVALKLEMKCVEMR
ncbi:MAG: hypothetical protein KBC30_09395 [Planctomycetes bacterium]|nr:hypothetical protein [Planctomycetota bacterium]HNZ67132.1 hypothetical protein [Planctomycetota bacterium]HPY73980.1 hypothetical protein [Planctomycetota bacterium]